MILKSLFWIYRNFFGPALHFFSVLFLGPGFGCRFTPSCSHYAEEAIRSHGWIKGSGMALGRISRCRPGAASSFDPVPPLN